MDNVAILPDSIVELSLENSVPKTMTQPIDKHVLYTTSDKTLNYTTNKVQYSMASMDKVPTVVSEVEKGDLYEPFDKLELYNCVKCSKSFRKQKQCEAHMKEAHSAKVFIYNFYIWKILSIRYVGWLIVSNVHIGYYFNVPTLIH